MPGPRSPRVATVDDDPAFGEALAGLLAALGMETVAYASAEAFLADGPPEDLLCLLLDQQMPGMDGMALLSDLARRGWRRPVVFITSRLEPAFRDRAMAAGALDVLAKPFAPDDLIRLLASAKVVRSDD